MTETKSNGDCSAGSCPVVKSGGDKLVKSTDLPIVGNPYPPKDVIQNEKPGMLEDKIRSIRTAVQPFFTPFYSAYEHTHDFVSIGVAHSQSSIQRLAENQSSIVNAIVISGGGLVGLAFARRRGVFKKLLYGSIGFGAATAACYPKDVEQKAQLTWYIAKTKLPTLAQRLNAKLTGASDSAPTTTKVEKSD